MDFQYNYSIYTQDGFHQEQGVQHIIANQAEGTYFYGVGPTTDFGVINQPVIWPEHQGYQPEQYHRLLDNSTALPQFLPPIDIPVFHTIPPQGNHGMPLQDEAAPFDPWPQGPVMCVDAMGQPHGTSVVLHPELQAPLVAMGGAVPQYGVPVPGPYAPHLQNPIIYVDAIGQQLGTAMPFNPQLEAPFIDGEGLYHGTSVPFNPYLQAPLDSTGRQHGTAVPFNLVPVPSYEPLQVTGRQQMPWVEEQASRPSPMAELLVQLRQENRAPTEVLGHTHSVPTSKPLNPEATPFMVSAEAMKAQDGQLKAKIQPQVPGTSVSSDCLSVKHKSQDHHCAMEDYESKPADKNASILKELKTALTTAVKAVVNLPKKVAEHKAKKRKRQNDKAEKERKEKRSKTATSPTKKPTKSSDGEQEGSDTLKRPKTSKKPGDKNNGSSKKSRGKKAKKTPTGLKPRGHLGEQMMHSVQVFHKLGSKAEKLRPQPHMSQSQPKAVYSIQPSRIPKVLDLPRQDNVRNHAPVRSHTNQPCYPAPKQSRPSAPVPQRQVQRPPAPAHPRPQHEVPHFYKNHASGSVADYGDGEVVIYLKPEYPGMFPLRLRKLPPLPPGAPRRFHCQEYSVTTTGERRADREAMKRAAKQSRDKEAKITRSGMDCSVLADRKQLPYEPWPNEDNWWETGLDDVWKFDECLEHIREDVV